MEQAFADAFAARELEAWPGGSPRPQYVDSASAHSRSCFFNAGGALVLQYLWRFTDGQPYSYIVYVTGRRASACVHALRHFVLDLWDFGVAHDIEMSQVSVSQSGSRERGASPLLSLRCSLRLACAQELVSASNAGEQVARHADLVSRLPSHELPPEAFGNAEGVWPPRWKWGGS